jgi:glycolate oxidase FAD binding subunit
MGAGTWLEMGNRATEAHLFVSTARMDRVLEYEPADLTATVEAGCTLAAFNERAAVNRQFIPLDPFGDARSTLGAIVASASYGPFRCSFGTPRDWVIGMRVAHSDGRITKAGGKVVKNVAGYDLCKLYTGSFGTLGVIGEMSFKLRALPSSERTVVCVANELGDLCALAGRISTSDLQPAAMELFSPRSPGLGDLINEVYALALRFLDEPEAIDAQEQDLARVSLGVRRFALNESSASEFWSAYRENETAPHWAWMLRLSVLPSDVATMIAEVKRLMPAATLCVHASNGVIRVLADAGWLGGLKTAQRPRKVAELRHAVQGRGGQMLIVRAPDDIKSQLDVWGDVGPNARLMRELKVKFDPQAQLNPGRFVAGI